MNIMRDIDMAIIRLFVRWYCQNG